MQDSFWIAVAAVVATSLVSAASTLAGGHISIRKSKLEKKTETLSDYLRWASVMVYSPISGRMEEYRSAYGAALLYASFDAAIHMEQLDDMILREHYRMNRSGETTNTSRNEMNDLFHKIFTEMS